jgi:phospho-N-acetylmuramoyl-pentapeptide-transferase
VLSLMQGGGVAFLVAVLATPMLIRFFRRHHMGQHIRVDGPQSHMWKEGTPTMGGVIIVAAALIGYVVSHIGHPIGFTRAGVLVAGVLLASGLLGFVDDVLGIRNARNLGLNKRAKFAGQLLIALVFALLAIYWVHTATTLSFTRGDWPGWQLGALGWGAMAIFILVATSNAVNFTDGVDGLAAGSSTFCFTVLAIMGYWQFRHPHLYHLKPSLDLGLIAVSLVGGCLGFLWWNAAPAKIIMGDTGALAIGTALGALCLLMNLDLLLPVIGGLFVVEAMSVVLQIFSFRVFHRRIFKIAPIHHHFEMKDWPETTILIRFWILAGMMSAFGLGIFYGDFLRLTKVV